MKIPTQDTGKYLLWIVTFLGIILYIHFMMYFPLDPRKITLLLMTKIAFTAIACNLGPLCITFAWAKKYKKITTLLFVPSILFTPLIAGVYFIPAFLIVMVLNVYLFIKFNPWKKYEMGPICA